VLIGYLQAVLGECILRECLDIILLKLNDLVLAAEVAFDLVESDSLGDVEQDEFVGDHTQSLLESDRLGTRPGETFDYPRGRGRVFLQLLNLVLH